MSVRNLVISVVFLCFLQTCVLDKLFDNINCGRQQSNRWLAPSPWLAAVRVLDKASGLIYTKCAGAVLNQKYVLTTAGCLSFDKGTELQGVQLDITYVENYTIGSVMGIGILKTLYGFQEIIVHPQYDPKTNENDIALMRLNRLVHYWECLQPVCLPFNETVQDGAFYTGTWGEKLQYFPRGKIYIESSAIVFGTRQILAVENENNNDTSCIRYVGSPLMFTKNGQYYLQGFLSKRFECDSKTLAEYLNLVGYLKWIKDTVTSNYYQCETPDNQKSTCVPLGDCPLLLKAFANPKTEHEEYLYKYICHDDTVDGFRVCCPLSLNASLYFNDEFKLDGLSEKKLCGYKHKDDHSHTAFGEFPWLATIRAVGRNNSEYNICSGSLINNRYVLTSAFCLIGQRQITSVRLSEFKNKMDCTMFTKRNCAKWTDYKIEEVVTHPFYDFSTYHNDLALIRLKELVTYSDYIRPICLPTSKFNRLKIDDTLHTTSFTVTKPWDTSSLKKLFYTLVDNHQCRYNHTVDEYNMCLQPVAKSVDASCFDDDGAPAMIVQNGQWTLEGITTKRASFFNTTKPITLTNISSYLHWIQETVNSGKLTLVIKTYINNEETTTTSPLLVSLNDNIRLHCYVNVTFGNKSFVKNNVEWSTPIYSNIIERNGSSVIIIKKVSLNHQGEYKCSYRRHRLSKGIRLKFVSTDIHFPDDFYNKKFVDREFKKYEDFPQFNFSDIKMPEIHYVSSYSDKGPILFFPGIIVIILGLTRMCYYMKNRNRVPWQRLRIFNCTHHLCVYRRRTDPSATCLLQDARSGAVSIVIVPRTTTTGVENTVTEPESDVPPSYNEIIPQELPPTYNEAIQNVSGSQT